MLRRDGIQGKISCKVDLDLNLTIFVICSIRYGTLVLSVNSSYENLVYDNSIEST